MAPRLGPPRRVAAFTTNDRQTAIVRCDRVRSQQRPVLPSHNGWSAVAEIVIRGGGSDPSGGDVVGCAGEIAVVAARAGLQRGSQRFEPPAGACRTELHRGGDRLVCEP